MTSLLRTGLLASVCLLVTAVLPAFAQPAAAPSRSPVTPAPRLGINLGGLKDWSTELPLADVSRLSRPWISQKKGEPWGKGPPLALDPRGYVTRLEPDCYAETIVCNIQGGHYPAGTYTVVYDGEGEFQAGNGAAKIVNAVPGKVTLQVDPSKGGIFLRLVKTNPDNYVRNLHILLPGYTDAKQADTFMPAFLDRWRGVACLRFMDWQETNGSKAAHWSDRPVKEDATYAGKGAPVEMMVDLANQLDADPWFCMPFAADDEYIRSFAALVKSRLKPERKVYIEFSNELWNNGFKQTRDCGLRGVELGLGDKDKPWEAGWRYNARRSVQIFKLWEEAFGGHERLVRVIATQAANAYIGKQILSFEDAYQHVDALAIGPYITVLPSPTSKHLTTDTVASWNVEELLNHVEEKALPQCIAWMHKHKELADQYGLKLIAYEGGQHLVGVMGGENNEAVTKLFKAANGHPRMGAIYTKYLAAWQAEGGDLFCHFSSVGMWSKYGSWGTMEYMDDDPKQSPKFMAIMQWARGLGQPVNLPR